MEDGRGAGAQFGEKGGGRGMSSLVSLLITSLMDTTGRPGQPSQGSGDSVHAGKPVLRCSYVVS